MKKTAIGLSLLLVLSVFTMSAEPNSTRETQDLQTKTERMIRLCEKAEAKLSTILEKVDNKEAEKFFKDASKDLNKAINFYEKKQYEKSIESCLDVMHTFRECAALIKEDVGERREEKIEDSIARLETYISRIREKIDNEAILALLNTAQNHVEKAKEYLEEGNLRNAVSEIQKAKNVLQKLREVWKEQYRENLKERVEKLFRAMERRVQVYEKILDRMEQEGYDVTELEAELDDIKTDIASAHELVRKGDYEEAVSKIREIYKKMQQFQEKLRGIVNEP